MLGRLRRPAGDRAEAVAGLLRERFGLDAAAVVVVSEVACGLPGCPPMETVALIWDAAGQAYRLKLFKPLAGVTADDLPPGWYLPALKDEGEDGCC